MAKKVSELQGDELDRWVANAHGMMLYTPDWQPSVNWSQGGPILEEAAIWLSDDNDDAAEPWIASAGSHMNDAIYTGRTPLEAAMRAYVHSRLGKVVDDES